MHNYTCNYLSLATFLIPFRISCVHIFLQTLQYYYRVLASHEPGRLSFQLGYDGEVPTSLACMEIQEDDNQLSVQMPIMDMIIPKPYLCTFGSNPYFIIMSTHHGFQSHM